MTVVWIGGTERLFLAAMRGQAKARQLWQRLTRDLLARHARAPGDANNYGEVNPIGPREVLGPMDGPDRRRGLLSGPSETQLIVPCSTTPPVASCAILPLLAV